MSAQTPEDRLTRLEDAVIQHAEDARESRVSLSKMSDALVTLARLEERHSETRAGLVKVTAGIEEHDKRLKLIEIQIPQLVEARSYIVRAGIAVVGIVGTAAFALAAKH